MTMPASWLTYLGILALTLALDALLIAGWRRCNQSRQRRGVPPISLLHLVSKSLPHRPQPDHAQMIRAALNRERLIPATALRLREMLRSIKLPAHWRIWALLAAICLALIAQYSLPPPHISVSDQSLPHPLWWSVLFMRGPLQPFRLAVGLYLAAVALVILAFGRRGTSLPCHSLDLSGSTQEPNEEKLPYQAAFSFRSDSLGLTINFEGTQKLWQVRLLVITMILCALGLGGCVFVLFYRQRASNPGLALWLLAIFILLATAALYEPLKDHSERSRTVCLWAGGALALNLASVGLLWHGKGVPGMLTWLGSAAVLVAGRAGLRRISAQSMPTARSLLASHGWEALFFLIIMGMASYFRLAHIGGLAPGLNNDAAEAGRAAISLAMGKSQYTPFLSIGWGFESLFIYYIAGLMQLMGYNILALRLAGISVGIVTVAALYLLGRRVGGARLGWLSAALLAASGIHIVYSNVGGHRLITQPLFDVLTLLFFWKALERRRLQDWLLSGACLGLAVNAHVSSRANPILYIVFVGFLFLICRRREFLKRYWAGLLTFGVSAFIAAAPIAAFAASNSTYNDRANFVFVGHRMKKLEAEKPGSYWDPLVSNLIAGVFVFNQRGNADDFFIADPAFDFPFNVLFVLGLAYTLRHWRKPFPFFLLIWFALAFAAGLLSKPNANRSFGAVVPACIMVALFVLAAADLIVHTLGERWRSKTAGIVLLLITLISWRTWDIYAGPNYRYRWGYAEEVTAVGHYVNRIRDNYAVYLTDSYYVTDTARMMTYRDREDPYWRPYARFDVASVLTQGFPGGRPVAVVLGYWTEEELQRDTLLELYPGSRVEPIPMLDTPWKPGRPAGYAIFIPESLLNTPARLQTGLLSKYYNNAECEGEPYQVFVDRFMLLPETSHAPLCVLWEGSLSITTAGEYNFRLRSTNRSRMYIDDRLILAIDDFDPENPDERHEADGTLYLTKGRHTWRFRYSYEKGDRQIQVFWKRPNADLELLPLADMMPATD